MSAPVDILLATYNGAAFLPDQLGSIAAQTHQDWRLIARDDGSTDATCALLGDFRARFPDRVVLVEDGDKQLGPKNNFGRLMRHSRSPYIAFSDQDDVWVSTKLGRLLEVAAKVNAPDHPWLVHSDLAVVDRNNALIAPSFWKYQFIKPARCKWQQQLVQSVVTGCTMLFNRALRETALPIPAEAVMHDWWLGLIAAKSGEILWTGETTVRYRQHGGNDTGAKRWGMALIKRKGQEQLASDRLRSRMNAYRAQARALSAHPAIHFSDTEQAVLRTFVHLDRLSYLERRRFLLKNGILKTGLLRNLAMFWFV